MACPSFKPNRAPSERSQWATATCKALLARRCAALQEVQAAVVKTVNR